MTAVVRGVSEPASGVRVFELLPSEGVAPYPLGSHIDVEVRLPSRTATRCYSLVGESPHDGAYRIAVKQVAESRGGSRFMWSQEPGAVLRISEPRSHFELRTGCAEYLLLAGGIGITPLVGMAEALARAGAPFRLLYAGHAREQMAFLPELRELLGERLSVFASVESSRVDLFRELLGLHPDAELYVCGPIGLMEAARREWRANGRAASRLRFETFGSSGHRGSEAFRVHVVDHGVELGVERDQSLLEALSAAGIEVPGHCRRGECGLCVVQVIERHGEIDHRDVFLDDEQRGEGRLLCPCVSRAIGRIAIDTGYRSEL
jgi:ferredoxin-NADP reductase